MATKMLMLRSNMVYFYSAYVILFSKTFADLQKKEVTHIQDEACVSKS